MTLKQFVLTPAAGKRLIGKALVNHPLIQDVLENGTLVIIAGTTNGYVAEEILKSVGIADDFSKKSFHRGITLPFVKPSTKTRRRSDENHFDGDVILVKGKWQKGLTIFDVVDDLTDRDVILKGANALDVVRKKAAVLVGHPQAGTIGISYPAVIGRRVKLIVPVGLEKRIIGDLDGISMKLNAPEAQGPRLFPVIGEVFTEIDAIAQLTGATAELVSSGGICGAEGSIWLAVSGEKEQVKAAEEILKSVRTEPLFEL